MLRARQDVLLAVVCLAVQLFAVAAATSLRDRLGSSTHTTVEAERARPVCLFVPGAGVDITYSVHNSFPQYWGKMHEQVLSVCRPRFLRFDTSTRGWDDMGLLHQLCAAIKAELPNVVIAHSMGNLAFSALLQRPDSCLGVDLAAIGWVAVQPPFRGSPAAAACKQICANKYLENPLLTAVQKSKELCNCVHDKPAASIISMDPRYKSPTKITWKMHAATAKRSSFTLCSNTLDTPSVPSPPATVPASVASGSGIAQPLHQVLANFVSAKKWGKDYRSSDRKPRSGHDGFVAFRQSCSAGFRANDFIDHPHAPRYIAHLSHQAGTGRHGENHKDDMQKPFHFYRHSIGYIIDEQRRRPRAIKVPVPKHKRRKHKRPLVTIQNLSPPTAGAVSPVKDSPPIVIRIDEHKSYDHEDVNSEDAENTSELTEHDVVHIENGDKAHVIHAL